MYHMITDKRHKTAHVAGANAKPLCRSKTKIEFTPTEIYPGLPMCGTCAELQLRAQWEARVERHKSMTPAEQLDDRS